MSDHTNTYEAMFLFPQAAAGNLKAASDHVLELIQRADAEVLALSKWDERRLAYEIRGNKRGVYFHAYFKASPTKIGEIERVANLSEDLLRFLVTRADHIPAEVIEASDGRQKLADEIAVKKDESATASSEAPSATVTSGSSSSSRDD